MVVCTVALVAWGVFAFGSPYPWAYGPLALGSALVGLLGLFTGRDPSGPLNCVLLVALSGIAVVAIVQLIPLPLDWLTRVSPGTVAYLARYRYSVITDPFGDTTLLCMPSPSHRRRPSSSSSSSSRPPCCWWACCAACAPTTAMRLTKGIVFVGFALAILAIGQKAALGDHAFGGMCRHHWLLGTRVAAHHAVGLFVTRTTSAAGC